MRNGLDNSGKVEYVAVGRRDGPFDGSGSSVAIFYRAAATLKESIGEMNREYGSANVGCNL